MIHEIIATIVAVNKLPAKVTATTDRRAAITGARYIMSCVRVGGLEAFADRHLHPAEVRRRPVRRRHHLRRRHSLRPAQHPGDPRFLQGHPRSRRARRAVPQLCQPDGDEHLGGARVWRRQHRRPLPRRAARRAPDRAGARRRRRASSTMSARASTTRPGTSTSAPRAARSRRTS